MFVLITHTSTSFFFSLHDALVTLYPHHRNPASWCMRSNFRCPRLHIFPSITGMSQFGLALLSRVREQAFPCGYITYFSYNKWLILFGKARIDLASIGTYKKKIPIHEYETPKPHEDQMGDYCSHSLRITTRRNFRGNLIFVQTS